MIFPFRDRQILVRSEQGVRHLHIRVRHQVMGAVLCGALITWAVAGTVGTAIGFARVDAQNDRITELRVGYAQVIARAAESRSRDGDEPVALGSGSDGHSAIADRDDVTNRVMAENARLRDALQAIRSEKGHLAAQIADMEDTAAERAATFAALEANLTRTSRAREEADYQNAVLDRELSSARTELAQLQLLSNDRAAEIGRLEMALSRAEDWNRSLETEVRDLSDSVNQAIETAEATAAERDRLAGRIDAMQASVEDAIRARDNAQGLMHAALDGAEAMRRNRNSALTVMGTEQARGDRLTGIIDDLVSSQQHVFAELRDRTDRQRRELAEGLAHTGLDIDSMIDDVWSEMYPGMGGPFLPVSGISFLDASVWSAAEDLTESVERATATHELASRLPVAMPIHGDHRLSSRFGPRRDPFTGRTSGHLGLDFAAPRGTAILAPAHGTVTFAGWRGAYGRLVEVDHGFGITTRYAHMTRISVTEGQEVSTGDEIGQVGTTGRSTGPHLHYEVRNDGTAMDPEHYIEAGNHVFAVTNKN